MTQAKYHRDENGKKGKPIHKGTGNQNATKHASYQSRKNVDGRTWQGTFLKKKKKELSEQVKSTQKREPDVRERILIDQIAFKELQCQKAQREMLSGKARPTLETDYLQWTSSIREDMRQLFGATETRPKAQEPEPDSKSRKSGMVLIPIKDESAPYGVRPLVLSAKPSFEGAGIADDVVLPMQSGELETKSAIQPEKQKDGEESDE